MSNYKNLVKNFSGIVHISDIQEEFDRLLNGLAELTKRINDIKNVAELDYSKGSPVLSAEDYTLTLGGLKRILGVYDKKSIEEPLIVKLPNETNKYKALPGLVCDKNVGIIQTKDNVLDISPNITNKINVYVDSGTHELTTTNTGNLNVVCQVRVDHTAEEIEANAIINEYIKSDDGSTCSIIPQTKPTLKINPTKTFNFEGGEGHPSSGSYFILPKVGNRDSAGSFKMNNITLYECGGNIGGNRTKRVTWVYNPIWYPVQANKLSFSLSGVTNMKYLRYKIQ